MSKKLMIFWIAAALLLAGCSQTPPATAQTQGAALPTADNYLEEMKPVMDEYYRWNNEDLKEYDAILDTYLDRDANVVTSQTEGAMRARLWLSLAVRYPEQNFKVLEYLQTKLAPVSLNVEGNGFLLLSKLNSLTPTPDLKTAHEQVASCVEYKINIVADMRYAVATFTAPSDGGVDFDPCNLIGPAILMLEEQLEQ